MPYNFLIALEIINTLKSEKGDVKMEKSQLEIFSQNLKRAMRDKDLSQNRMAQKLGCSVPTVNSWCQGYTMPRRELFDKLCALLGVQRSDLLTDKTTIPNLSIPAAHPLPILGRICCGNGVLADENFDGMFFVDNSIRADYCLRVEGDSMKDAGINHGDIAFIRKSYDFLQGGIYAVVYGEDQNAVLKKVYRQGNGLLLMPCNQKYDPISVDDCRIVGELIGVYSPRSN